MVHQPHTWIKGDSDMGERIRAKDWTQTSLGPMQDWPASLRNMVNLVVETQIPAVVCWGKDLNMIYNDAYRPLLGEKHEALGKPFLKVWSEAADIITPYLEETFEGEASFLKVDRFTLNRFGQIEDAWFDFCFSPLRDESGEVGGILNTAIEKTQEIKAEQALRETQVDIQRQVNLYETLLSSISDFVYIFDRKGRVIYANEPLLDLWGLQSEEAIGKDFFDLPYPDELAEKHQQQIQKVIDTRQELMDENSYTSPAGKTGYYEYIFRPVLGEEGRVEYVVGSTRDITGRINTEKTLLDSEKQLRIATQAASLHLCEVNLDKDTFEWSENVEHNVDFPMPDTIEAAEALLHPDDKNKVLKILNQVAEENGEFEIEYRVVDPINDNVIWVYSAGAAIAESGGEYKRIVAATKNITKRKQSEIRKQFLSRLNAKIQRISDPNQIMAVTARLMGDHLDVDRCIYAEIEEDENHFTIRGNFSNDEILHMERHGALSDFGKEALKSMRRNTVFVVDDIEKDGRITKENEAAYRVNQIQALICVPVHKEGKLVAKLEMHQQMPRKWLPEEIELVRTVTSRCWEALERARVTRELKKMNKTLEEQVEKRTESLKKYQVQLRSLASELSKAEERERQNLASELHNNLGQMLAVGKIKLDTLKNTDLNGDAINAINDVTALLDDALTYTRELMADLKPPPALDNANLKEILSWVAGKMEKHGLDVSVEGDDPRKLGEEMRTTLHRSVSELLFNVIKHAGVDEARVVVSNRGEEVLVTVKDEGKGFNMKEAKPTPANNGGFGLFNIRERMDWLGGSFEIVSEPGNGTSATLYAPALDESGNGVPSAIDTKAGQHSVQPSPLTEKQEIEVLLVDDHEMMRKGLRRLIEEQEGLTIIAEASDGEEAIKLAEENFPDVIIMDINMPGMNGIEATDKINKAQPDICIIGLSIHDSEEVARDMKNAGATAYLTKTEAFESLGATIGKLAKKT